MGSHNVEGPDTYLVKRSQDGDNKSFELLIIKYQSRIFNVIFRVVRDRDAVEDLAQETFLNAFKSIKRFKGGSSFYTWIYRIAVNVSINYISKRKKAVFVDEGVMETEAVTDRVSTAGDSPEMSMQGREFATATSRAIEKIPADIRTAIILREYEGLSYQEISDATDSPIGTVRSRIFRGRAMLKEMLQDYL
ncbi:MAG: sigma-70 family RNA polymerase sigma factor [Proteobacteria bacterium]|nr:sigma-70 family RNA polymerase sigma factor [Pseudomonadota bacterium]